MQKIYGLACGRSTRRWVLDADIAGAFDNLCQDFLGATIGAVPGRGLIKQWLQAGYLEDGVLYPTLTGTGQGAVSSPLLLNVALHGMEEALGVSHDSQGHLKGSRAVVRYADDLVVFSRSRDDAEQARDALQGWLAQRGLTLSEEKTRIVHLTEGFDFLGFTVRQYPVRNTRSGFKLLITPSAASVRTIKARLREEWLRLRGANAEAVIRRLNPLIRGWAEYFRRQCASRVFHDLDYVMWRRECRYVQRAHPRKSWKWRKSRYWGRFHPDRQDQWVFGSATTGHYLLKFAWLGIKRHILVRGRASPDDPTLQEYWRQRARHEAGYLSLSKRRMARHQSYVCPGCGESLCNGEELQVHHLVPRHQGGSDAYTNLTLRHLYCHHQEHRASHET